MEENKKRKIEQIEVNTNFFFKSINEIQLNYDFNSHELEKQCECYICLKILEKPVRLKCDHFVCLSCVKKLLKHIEKKEEIEKIDKWFYTKEVEPYENTDIVVICEMCQTKTCIQDIKIDIFVEGIISCMNVFCLFCEWKGPKNYIMTHFSKECKECVMCKECNSFIQKNNKNHFDDCPNTMTTEKCIEIIKKKDLEIESYKKNICIGKFEIYDKECFLTQDWHYNFDTRNLNVLIHTKKMKDIVNYSFCGVILNPIIRCFFIKEERFISIDFGDQLKQNNLPIIIIMNIKKMDYVLERTNNKTKISKNAAYDTYFNLFGISCSLNKKKGYTQDEIQIYILSDRRKYESIRIKNRIDNMVQIPFKYFDLAFIEFTPFVSNPIKLDKDLLYLYEWLIKEK